MNDLMNSSAPIVVSSPAPMSKKERKRARKMARNGEAAVTAPVRAPVMGSLIQRGVAFGVTKLYIRPEVEAIDKDEKLSPEQKSKAKRDLCLKAAGAGLIGEHMLAGGFANASSGVSAAGAVSLAWI